MSELSLANITIKGLYFGVHHCVYRQIGLRAECLGAMRTGIPPWDVGDTIVLSSPSRPARRTAGWRAPPPAPPRAAVGFDLTLGASAEDYNETSVKDGLARVLEVPAGFAQAHGWQRGDRVALSPGAELP